MLLLIGTSDLKRNHGMKRFLILLMTLAWAALPQTAAACGAETDCLIGERTYRVRLPEGAADGAKLGAIIMAHGYRGTAAGIMRNQNLAALADELGVVLVATKSANEDWDIPGVPSNVASTGAEELAYYDAVLAAMQDRHNVDPARIMMTGFSAGGMMVWTLACHRSGSFAGFAPIAGTFWDPVPESCQGPVANIVHIHGDADPTVPLEGRRIAQTRQGSVPQAVEMYQRYGGFGPAQQTPRGRLRCDMRENPAGAILDFCLFSGGHSFTVDFVRSAWGRLAAAGLI